MQNALTGQKRAGEPARVALSIVRPGWLAAAFLALVMPLGIVLATLTPPGQVADETGHLMRAAALTRGEVIGHRHVFEDSPSGRHLGSGVNYDRMLVIVANELGQRQKLDAARDSWARTAGWSNESDFMDIGNLAVYMPIFYAPAAAAIVVARAFHGRPFDVIRTGRLVNLAAFLAVATAALLITRRAQALMFCVLAVPMTVSLGASFNQDGLLIATACLAAALLSRSQEPGHAPETLAQRPGYLLAAVLIALIAIVKLPYLPLTAMLLVPLPRRGQWRAQRGIMLRRLAIAGLIAAPALAWTALALASVSVAKAVPAYSGGPLWPGDPARIFTTVDTRAQLQVLAAHPLAVITLVWTTIIHDYWLIREGIGILGFLDVFLPTILYHAWQIAIVAAVAAALLRPTVRRSQAQRYAQPEGGLAWPDGLLLVAATATCIWAIYMSQYLTWTTVGMDHVDGPSGRYFLPLIPMLALALPRVAVPGGRVIGAALSLAPPAAALAGLVLVPLVVVSNWYLR